MSQQQQQPAKRSSSSSKGGEKPLVTSAKGVNVSKETAANQLIDEIVFKVVFVGPTGAGKTALVQTVIRDKIHDETLMPTVGVDFFSKIINIKKPKKLNLRLQMWDCGGKPNYAPSDDEFKTILTNANAVVLCYDTQNHHSLEDVRKNWLPLVEARTKPWSTEDQSAQFDPVCCFLVGTHGDQKSTIGKDDDNHNAADLELDDIDDILFDELNEGGFPSKGKQVTNDDLEALVKQFEVLYPSQVVKCSARDPDEVRKLTQDICTNLIKAYSKRRGFEKEQKEKKKEQEKEEKAAEAKKKEADKENAKPAIEAPPRGISRTPPAQPQQESEFSPREGGEPSDEDDAAPPPSTGNTTRPPSLSASKIRSADKPNNNKSNAFGGRDSRSNTNSGQNNQEPLKEEEDNSRKADQRKRSHNDQEEEPPTVTPGKKDRRKAAESNGCCAGDCLIS